ncbi:deoxyguanosinetriphosphate triphosphohydrolase [Suipraeoptans intestinalis]|uniref:Deoxyguanosinetriphosphate triphosphohydrolase-like protein n=1 Tax=Suipraeoptans intestinalis TaxID=2606628 RepID=A0A6N7UTQ8_9FIRM|nr:deoxyguanosinetriphosphate triphosphohydrolase [Suipraeoptans intestinalis]MDD7770179.1 deoxyguanosinetriphosphate triphosphohydrolase [Suipraeoptans intestinalis]MDY3122670.1 deoxyguanosinetriphosphate triphosphohydrolase [Suipraeoptans intestinalis]MSR94788.1 deoxyguanosinetriphosphate triphosphohydrolase [Suipraeoptans intestinalis]
MTIREQMELWEEEYLSPYAAKSARSRGREREEEECDIRPIFQRDRDRILHCKSFRRMKQKTQVFLMPEGDHYRTRLTHTLEVSQNARTIAKALRLNEDLTEAIALGHDLGHPPFGHAGERALDEVCSLGFQHNRQSVRVVECLEKEGKGLNLAWEVRDGILHHKTSGSPGTLEGQVVQLSDKIAYLNHDIDDAIRGGILTEEDLPRECTEILGKSIRARLDTMVHNVITSSMGKDRISMSPEVMEATRRLRRFMFEQVYLNPQAKGEEAKAIHLVTSLYEYYLKQETLLPSLYLQMMEKGVPKEQAVCDYITGMTDSYAIKQFETYFVPKVWKI